MRLDADSRLSTATRAGPHHALRPPPGYYWISICIRAQLSLIFPDNSRSTDTRCCQLFDSRVSGEKKFTNTKVEFYISLEYFIGPEKIIVACVLVYLHMLKMIVKNNFIYTGAIDSGEF